MKKNILFIVAACCSTSLVAQNEYKSPQLIFEEAASAYVEEDYDAAYQAYMKINKSDTAYYESRLNAVMCALTMEKHDSVVQVSREALSVKQHHNAYERSFMNSLAVGYKEQENYDKALEILDSGLALFPDFALMYRNRGDVLIKLEKYNEAVIAYQNAIRFDPKSYVPHLKLGMLCAENGDITKALLSLNMACALTAGTETSHKILALLEAVAKGEAEHKDRNLEYPEEEDFEDIDLILENKVAFNGKYKVKSKLKFPYVAQNQIMMEKLEYDEDDNGFWNQNYVRYFSKMHAAGHVEAYNYFLAAGIEQPSVQKVVLKGKRKIIAYSEWSENWFTRVLNERTVREPNGTYADNRLWHFGNYGFNIDADIDLRTGIATGDYIAYHDNGLASAQGKFDPNGKKTGTWKYWNKNGALEVSHTFENDELKGDRVFYYANGSKQVVIPIDNNEVNGTRTTYYPFDKKFCDEVYTSGKKNGVTTYYYKNGEKSSEISYKDGQYDGPSKDYFANGQLKEVTNYVAGEKQGEYKAYHANGEIHVEGQFENDLNEGHWKFYHDNGQLEEEGDFLKGNRIGTWTNLRWDGTKHSVSNFGENGKKTGVYLTFDRDGNPEMELTYKGEEIVAYKFFSDDGEVIAQGEKKRKELELEGYHVNGNMSVKGNYYKANKVGLWSYYDINGVLNSTNNYDEDGLLQGESKTYFPNGNVEVAKTYKDNRLDGEYVDYFRNGDIYLKGWYVDGDPEGEWITYYDNGSIRSRDYYIGGELNGFSEAYDTKGKLRSEGYYFEGFLQTRTYYDTTGNVDGVIDLRTGDWKGDIVNQGVKVSEFNYEGTDLNGPAKWYDLDRVVTEGEFMMDKRHGEWTWYHANGQKSDVGTYVNGSKEGEWMTYYDSGKLRTKSNYVKGELHGEKTWYYENGQIDQKRQYVDGRRHGKSTYYDQAGEIRYFRYHDGGALIGYAYLGSDGQEIPMIEFNGQNGDIQAKFKNGKPSYSSHYEKGFTEGKYTVYNSNGNVAIEGNDLLDLNDGEYKRYYPDGQLKFQGNYKADKLYGMAKEYYPNGKIQTEKNYTRDNLDGWSKYYDKSGKLVKRELYYEGDLIKSEIL